MSELLGAGKMEDGPARPPAEQIRTHSVGAHSVRPQIRPAETLWGRVPDPPDHFVGATLVVARKSGSQDLRRGDPRGCPLKQTRSL